MYEKYLGDCSKKSHSSGMCTGYRSRGPLLRKSTYGAVSFAVTSTLPVPWKGTREYIEILRLTENYGIYRIEKLLKELEAKNQLVYASNHIS